MENQEQMHPGAATQCSTGPPWSTRIDQDLSTVQPTAYPVRRFVRKLRVYSWSNGPILHANQGKSAIRHAKDDSSEADLALRRRAMEAGE